MKLIAKSCFLLCATVASCCISQSWLFAKSLKRDSPYLRLMEPIDIYQTPPKISKLISLDETFKLVREQGLEVGVARETFRSAREELNRQSDRILPNISLVGSSEKSFTTLQSLQAVSEADAFNLTEKRSQGTLNELGLLLTSAPVQGLSFSAALPKFRQDFKQGEGSSSAAILSGYQIGLSLSLVKDNLFLQSH